MIKSVLTHHNIIYILQIPKIVIFTKYTHTVYQNTLATFIIGYFNDYYYSLHSVHHILQTMSSNRCIYLFLTHNSRLVYIVYTVCGQLLCATIYFPQFHLKHLKKFVLRHSIMMKFLQSKAKTHLKRLIKIIYIPFLMTNHIFSMIFTSFFLYIYFDMIRQLDFLSITALSHRNTPRLHRVSLL